MPPLPGFVGRDDVPVAVVVLDFDPAGRLGTVVAVVADVTAGTEEDREGGPRSDERRQVQGREQGAFLVIGPGRVEDAVSRFPAVDPELVIPKAADERRGRDDLVLQRQLLAQVNTVGLDVFPAVFPEEDVAPALELAGGLEADPFRLPFLLVEEGRAERGHLAPGRDLVAGVPPPHAPVKPLDAQQGLAAVFDAVGARRFDPVGVPVVADAVLAERPLRRHEDLIGPLGVPAVVAPENPGEAGQGCRDAQGRDERFDAQIDGGQRGHSRSP